MNRELMRQCLDALESLNAMSYASGTELMNAIEAELSKPEPEPVAYLWRNGNDGPSHIVMQGCINPAGAHMRFIGPLYCIPSPVTVDKDTASW